MKHINRRLLPDAETLGATLLPPPIIYSPDPLLQPKNTSTKSRLYRSNSHLDSSMALTALVLLTALFFMGFLSLFLRRFASSSSSSSPRRPSPPYSSSLPIWRTSNHPGGLDPCTIRSLPLVSYGGDAKRPIDCVICLCEFEEGETVKMIPDCRHVFHPECIDTWLGSRVSCPLCRSSRCGGVVVVMQGEFDGGEGEDLGRSTVVEINEEEEEVVVGPVRRVRRACSYPSLGDRVVVERSFSF